jgi:Domain of unknown function (DUF4123)
MTPEAAERVKNRLFYRYEPHGTELFAVLDGARNVRIARELRRSGLAYHCLFSGHLAPALQEAAPYIVQLTPDAAFTGSVIEQGWDESWGIYLASHSNLWTVRSHLRSLLRVSTEAGKKLFFRFYDPRVLRSFLPTCNVAQVRQVFGPVLRFDMPSERADRLLRFRRTAGNASGALRSWVLPFDGSADEQQRDE